MPYDVILPAGGTLPEDFAAKVGTNRKALIRLGDETVLGSTLRSMRESGLAARIAVIGGDEVLNHPDAQLADERIPETTTGPLNILKGLEVLAGHPDRTDEVLVITCDLPFVTKEVIEHFLELCPAGKEICVPLISSKSYETRFPGTKATYVTLRDDTWTTGCLYRIQTSALRKAQPHIERVFENRKSVWGMAKLLGPAFVLKWLLKSLTVDDVEKKIVSLLGCSGSAVRNSPPELAFDIDYLEDYEYALSHTKKLTHQ